MLDIPMGIITQAAAANPLATYAAGAMSVLAVIGLTARFLIRNRMLDAATDKHIERLGEEIKNLRERADREIQGLRERCEKLDDKLAASHDECNELAGKLAHAMVRLAGATATIEGMQQRLAGVETENMRLRDQNELQAVQLIECDREARAAKGQIEALQRQVTDLESRQDRSEHRDGEI